MSDITFEIVEQIGVLEEYPSGWSKELNLVSWNEASPKYDIRDWDREHKHMSRGIMLTRAEFKNLAEIVKGLEV